MKLAPKGVGLLGSEDQAEVSPVLKKDRYIHGFVLVIVGSVGALYFDGSR